MNARSNVRPLTLRPRAFTIVELLVVIAVIGVLVGLILPALSGVQKRGHKAIEMNDIKQIGIAWNLYAQNNNDAALPGYLSIQTQTPPTATIRGWGVAYQYPDHTNIPPAPAYLPGNPNIAGPWTWRLLSYLNYNHDAVHGYAAEVDVDKFAMAQPAEAQAIAEQPAFGYNGYYIGGYWDQLISDGSVQRPVYKYYDHCGVADGTRLLIPTTIAQIKRSSDMVAFCSSTKLAPSSAGQPFYGKLRSDLAGAHLVSPPTLATEPQWRPFAQNPLNAVEVLSAADAYVPLQRFTSASAVLFADGHCDSESYNALFDQRKWIVSASSSTYTHDVCPP